MSRKTIAHKLLKKLYSFPTTVFDDPLENSQYLCDAAILCPTNDEVERINVGAIERMQGTATEYRSIDVPLNSAVNNFDLFRSDNNLETINQELPSGFPPHKLNLKVKNF